MSYKCPLCIKPLTEEERLVRVCFEHPPSVGARPEEFECTEENLEERIFCPQQGWCNSTIETGVFLRHVGCEAKNPFWHTDKIVIPGSDNQTSFEYTTKSGGGTINLQVIHWEIGMLRRMPPAQEMWFPMMLLRATGGSIDKNNSNRFGALVGLVGTLSVGKSVIAMQAMEYEGYVAQEDKGRHIDVRGFLFSRMKSGRTVSTNPFLGNLYINNLLSLNKSGLFPLPGTDRMPGDLKVAFLKPSASAKSKSVSKPVAPARPQQDSRGPVKRLFGGLWSSSKEIVKGIGELVLKDKHCSFWYTVAFYDASGESFVYGDSIPDEIERAVDKIAIIVDATEVFGVPSAIVENSISVANDRIKRVKDKGLSCSLVVTKLDLVTDKLTGDEREKVKEIAEKLEGDPEAGRALLKEWLERRRNDDDSIKQLSSRLDEVERVFFVWTENLPTMDTTGKVLTSTKQPRSYGLAKFICWCLGIDWSDINQVK